MRSAALVVLGPIPTRPRTTDTQSLRIWAMWLHETRKVGEMDMAMLTVEEMPSKLGLELLDSAGQRRLGHAAATLPGSSGFRVSPWIALS